MIRRRFQFSILTALLVILVTSVGTAVWQYLRPMTDFEIVISGELADELPKDTVLSIWRVTSGGEKSARYRLSDLPIRLPRERYTDSTWNVSFYSPSLKSRSPLFTVELARDLFKEPRRINIKLDAPKPILRPFLGDWRSVRYRPNITQRMHYRDLPFWNENKLLTDVRGNPILRVENLTRATEIQCSEMTDGCWGAKWFDRLDDEVVIEDGDQLRFSVEYQSGGLFGNIGAEHIFTYNKSRHGR